MTTPQQAYIVLVVIGLFLIGAEIFLPGGVLGVLGALALFGAAVLGFSAFGPQGGFISALGLVIGAAACIALWVKFFPKTAMGKKLTLQGDGRDFKAGPQPKELVGKIGVVLTPLRPSGIAQIEGHRVDVIADGEWIEEKNSIQVVRVEGFRVLVRQQAADAQTKGQG